MVKIANPPPREPIRRANPVRRTPPRTGTSDGERVVMAALLALVLHLFVLWLAPRPVRVPPEPERRRPVTYQVVIEEPPPIPVVPVLEQQFIRAPLDVPQEDPGETPYISDRDQRAAQPEASLPSEARQPATKGEEAESDRVVQGNPFQQEVEEARTETGEQAGEAPLQERRAAPLVVPRAQEATEITREPPPEGEGVAPPEAQPEAVTTAGEDAPQAVPEFRPREPADGSDRLTTPAARGGGESQAPRPRPRVERDNSYGPLRDNRAGVVRVGNLAVESQYSEFGEYWRRLAEVVERRWNQLIFNSQRSLATARGRVTIEFYITSQGTIEEAKVTESTAGRLEETLCLDAITSQAPYDPWTPEMILSGEQRIANRITFIYGP